MNAPAIALPPLDQTRSISLPWLPFLPLLALLFAGTEPETVDNVIVAVEILFLVMAVRNPIWVLGALMTSELTLRNYFIDFGGVHMSTRLFISLVSVIIVLPQFAEPDLGARAKLMILLAAAFIGLTTFANAIASDASYVAQFLRYVLTGFIALVLIPLVIKSRDDLTQVSLVAFVIGMASAIVAVMQHYHFRGAPIIATVPNNVFDTGFEAWQGRSLGLAENPIYLTNDLLLVLLPVAGVLLTKAVPERVRPYLGLTAIILVGALYFTQTRSWVFSAVAGLIVMALLLSPRMRRDALVFVLLAGFMFWAWSEHSGSRYTLGPSNDDSAATRPVLWTAAFDIAKDHPVLGVGHDKFLELSPEYADRIDRGLLENQNAGDALGRFEPHNDYLNVWLSWGSGALALYLLITWQTIVNLKDAYERLSDPLMRGVALGGLGALVAFCVNSFFHNFFDSTLTLWVLAGLSLALMKLAAHEREAEVPS